jgi:bacillolysin
MNGRETMKTVWPAGLALAVFGMGMMQAGTAGPAARLQSVSATSAIALSEWDQRIDAFARRGDLRVLRTREDTMLAGRTHTRYEQLHDGVPVWGGGLVRQEDAAGTLTVFGGLYEGIDIETRPVLSENAARSVMLKRSPVGSSFFPDELALTVLPKDSGGYSLTWRGRVFTGADIRMTFIDAASGDVVLEYSDLQTQTSAVGTATGVLGDTKKISVTSSGSTFQAQDALRPPLLLTLDLKGSLARLNTIFSRFPSSIVPSDYAVDADNAWTDGAAVDAHVYEGLTYDYFFKRFGRRGLDNANIPIRGFVHPVRREDLQQQPSNIVGTYYLNAFYAGDGVMVYGEGMPTNFTSGGQRWNYVAGALDVVAHELTHGVTDYSSGLIYQNESGALNEAFSDMMGTAVEFYYQDPGTGSLREDYLIAEDVVTPAANPLAGIRSMQNPTQYDDPDHYSVRFTGASDNGGVHTNSGIANHAFYLAIEGGTHRLGARVTGVGAANREQIERVFYRGFTMYLVPSSNFAAARAATIQAARDLYPTNAAVVDAVTQAWTAVGVN